MNDKTLSLLGIARRAGKISCGHDAAVQSIVKNSAKLCLCCENASERLKKEMKHSCEYENKNIPFFEMKYQTETLSKAIGTKAAVITIDDEGFAKRLCSLLTETAGKE